MIAGGRELHVGAPWWPPLDALAERYGVTEVWEGACTGADEGVKVWARARGKRVESFPAAWELFPSKAAGPRRNEDMLEGRRCYELAPHGVITTEEVAGSPELLIALPGNQGTRRMVRAARDRGIIVEYLALEPQVLNHWHFNGKGDRLPPRSRSIQRGKSALANPHLDLVGYKRWLWAELQKDSKALAELQSIEPTAFLVCSCVRPDGKVLEDGRGGCHGHVVVKAWQWLREQA